MIQLLESICPCMLPREAQLIMQAMMWVGYEGSKMTLIAIVI